VIELLNRNLYYPIVAVLAVALLLRKRATDRKRMAIVAWAGVLVALRACAWLFGRLRIPDALFFVPVVSAAAFVWALHRHFLPLRLRCAACSARLGIGRMLASDDGLCERCAAARSTDPAGRDETRST
jgi:hypothetical protein